MVITDICNEVNAGKTIAVNGTQIMLNGWSGTGSGFILDLELGAGAYMIGGGLDGYYINGVVFGSAIVAALLFKGGRKGTIG